MSGGQLHPRNPLFSAMQRAVRQAEQPAFWEAARVEYVLKTLNLTAHRTQLRLDNAGGPLTFEAVNAKLGLPIVLTADAGDGVPLHRLDKAVHPNWFKKFGKLPFAQVYFERFAAYSLTGDTRPLALVFPRKGFAQGLCVHNGPLQQYVADGAGVHLYRSPIGDVTVQPFRDVISVLKENWYEDRVDYETG
jgi:hypothetical protein